MTSLLHHVRDRLHAKLLTLLPEPTPTTPTIVSMGQAESGMAVATVQAVMEWLFASEFLTAEELAEEGWQQCKQ